MTFKNGNTFKQIRANKEARDLDSWCVNWGRRDADGKAVRETRHFYVGQFYTKEDRDYNRAKERARQFAIEFRKEKVREMDQATLLRDRINYEQLSAQAKLQDYRPPKNRVAARQSGVQGRTRERKTRDYEGRWSSMAIMCCGRCCAKEGWKTSIVLVGNNSVEVLVVGGTVYDKNGSSRHRTRLFMIDVPRRHVDVHDAGLAGADA